MARTIPRLPLALAGIVSLLAGLMAGEARLGWDLPLSFVHLHGPLMVCGFFGTVIGLERAVALNRPWAYGAPFATAAGALLLLTGVETSGAILLSLGSLIFLAVALTVVRRQPEPFTRLLALGALAWSLGNVLWTFGAAVPQVVPLWASFLVLTIAGERLELSRFLKPWRWRNPTLVPPVALIATGAGLAAAGLPLAWTLFGLGCVALVAWSLINDIIRRTIRQPGLTRYVAICLLSGYVWLGVAGMLAPALDAGIESLRYDATLHALFVGFIFAMVFGHAPVILPAVLKVKLPFRGYFYGPLAVLHASLMLRVAGDLLALDSVRMWGGLLNGVAVLGFVVMVVGTVLSARPNPPSA
ncbi:MAG: hypothetical protein H7Z12_10755 [Rhodospirillaceae bacterium]|nr:hypothetical protein [Rhodospirillales bacterium]